MCSKCRARDLRINARQILNRFALRRLAGQLHNQEDASAFATASAIGPLVAAEQFDPPSVLS